MAEILKKIQKFGGTNTLLVPGSQKLGGGPVPMVVAPMHPGYLKQENCKFSLGHFLVVFTGTFTHQINTHANIKVTEHAR
jgi:hypothetical protein